MTRKKKPKTILSTTQIVLLSFVLLIFVGSGLLSLPWASADGVAVLRSGKKNFFVLRF